MKNSSISSSISWLIQLSKSGNRHEVFFLWTAKALLFFQILFSSPAVFIGTQHIVWCGALLWSNWGQLSQLCPLLASHAPSASLLVGWAEKWENSPLPAFMGQTLSSWWHGGSCSRLMPGRVCTKQFLPDSVSR